VRENANAAQPVCLLRTSEAKARRQSSRRPERHECSRPSAQAKRKVGSDAQAHDIAVGLGCAVVFHPPDDPRMRAWKQVSNWRNGRSYLTRNKASRATDVLMSITSPLKQLCLGLVHQYLDRQLGAQPGCKRLFQEKGIGQAPTRCTTRPRPSGPPDGLPRRGFRRAACI
jgi:hypothetical protein